METNVALPPIDARSGVLIDLSPSLSTSAGVDSSYNGVSMLLPTVSVLAAWTFARLDLQHPNGSDLRAVSVAGDVI